MTRALVLNAGASWCAYQVGALRQLVDERRYHFDICAGTGIGAMNAAFVACGRLPALDEFWARLRLLDLVPSRRRRFMAAHLDEGMLAERGTTLVVTAMNLQEGRPEVLRYPGARLPLVDGLLAAGALPGMTTPVPLGGDQLVEGTLIDGVPMAPVLALHPDEIVAVLPMLPAGGGPVRRYGTWRAVGRRALEVNQSEDGRRGLADAAEAAAEARAYRRAGDGLTTAAAGLDDGGALAGRLRGLVEAAQPAEGPRVLTIRPADPLPYPMWRFRTSDLAAAVRLGERDARAAR
jgi:predicted acylesterase/phospholipase RssA